MEHLVKATGREVELRVGAEAGWIGAEPCGKDENGRQGQARCAVGGVLHHRKSSRNISPD